MEKLQGQRAGKRIKTNGRKALSGKKPQGTDGNALETTGQKMKRLAQEWKDAYNASGSKEGGMEKVLSLRVSVGLI